jgi:putative nucleotidyltransferase with HDIG domain
MSQLGDSSLLESSFSSRNTCRKEGYESIALIPLRSGAEIIGLLQLNDKKTNRFSPDNIKFLEGIGASIGIALARKQAEEDLRQSLKRLSKITEGIVEAIVTAVEARDPYTAGHQKRVANLACAIARETGLASDRIEGLRMAALIHDLGKISIPADILSKPNRLSDLEYQLIKAHSESGYNIIKDIDFPFPVARIVSQHHERLDGSGYPRGLKGDEILPEANILGVADVVEAMASHRPYRPGLGIDLALEEIKKNKGVLYDTSAVEACLRLFRGKGFRLE